MSDSNPVHTLRAILPRLYCSSRTATPGRSLHGGLGANGLRGGGGGGGGFYGGGGGGSGKQGGGGGGGSSYADIDALSIETVGTQGVGTVRVVGVGETWVEVEWDRVMDAKSGAEPVWYEVRGRGYYDAW